jgi:hypothetical protein
VPIGGAHPLQVAGMTFIFVTLAVAAFSIDVLR